jgi:ribose transport system permease protein
MSAASGVVETEREGILARHDWRSFLARFALLGVLLAFVVFFSIARPDTYFTVDNLTTTLSQQAVLGILVIALILPLVIGEFDLSVAANLGLGAILVTGLPAKSGVGLVPAMVLTLVACSAVGLVNGLLVARVGINSLIVTLGMSTIVSGGVLWYTNGAVIYNGIPPGLGDIANADVLGIPLPGVCLFVVAVVTWFVLEQTPFGRYLYALGGSKEASELSGLPVRKLTVAAFVLCGLLAGVAGILQAGLLGVGNPTVGPPFLLAAFAAVFLGATAVQVGVFNVWGSMIAVFTLAAGITGLQLMGVAFYVAPVFQGVALLVAVIVVRVIRKEAL